MEKAAELLEQRYARPVTYEGPIWRWMGDLQFLGRLGNGKDVITVRPRSFVMPAEASPSQTPTLDASLLAKVVEAYNRQNPDGAHFRASESRLGVHIVPMEANDEGGNHVPVSSLLDTRISVPVQRRTATEHVTALCQTVTAASGTALRFFDWSVFDKNFAANGYLLPQKLSGSERSYMLFEWGVTGVTARDALIDLLDRSSTTMTWRLHCGQPGEGCGLGLYALAIGPDKRLVYFDRCEHCQPVPTK